jgi:putative DNA primase/helicase
MKTTIQTKLRTAVATIRGLFASARARFAAEVHLPPVSAQPAGCDHIEALLLHLCDGDELRALWVERWLALPLRAPGIKMPTALIVNGLPGVGVTLFFEQVAARLYGGDARCIPEIMLGSARNDWADESARLVIVNGSITPDAVARLKNLITSDTIMIKKPARQAPSMMNFVFTTNSPDYLGDNTDTRRLFIIDTPPPRPEAFYRTVVDEIAGGGVEAFRDHLLRLDLGDFNGCIPVAEHLFDVEAA